MEEAIKSNEKFLYNQIFKEPLTRYFPKHTFKLELSRIEGEDESLTVFENDSKIGRVTFNWDEYPQRSNSGILVAYIIACISEILE